MVAPVFASGFMSQSVYQPVAVGSLHPRESASAELGRAQVMAKRTSRYPAILRWTARGVALPLLVAACAAAGLHRRIPEGAPFILVG